MLKSESHYTEHGKAFTIQSQRIHWRSTAEVVEIQHHKDMSAGVHRSMWYTVEEWTAMEERNLRQVWEEQLRREMAHNGFIDAEFEFESDSLWDDDALTMEDDRSSAEGTPRNPAAITG